MPANPSFYLSEQELVEIHDRVIGLFGGMAGIRDRGALASCTAQPQTAVFGVERFPTIFDKAAAYCFFIVRGHPFFDGNKRTGLMAALTFLTKHGFKWIFDKNEMYNLIIRMAAGEADLEELAVVFRDACHAGEQDTQD